MGNSEQGCTCMRPRERNSAASNWKNIVSEDFEILFSKGHKWAENICGLLILWDGKMDKLFKNNARWQVFLNKECEKSALEYQVNPTHKNLFKELELDFKDNRNPLAAILAQFLQSYTVEIHDEVWDVILEGTEENAEKMLNKIVEDIKTVIEILVRACLSFYSNIYKLLKGKGCELRGIFQTQIISGDLYRLIYDLSLKLNKNFCTKVNELVSKDLTTDPKVVQIFRQIAVSESPFEKLYHLFDLKALLIKEDWPHEKLNDFVWTHIIESKVKDIFVHLYIIDLFTLEPIDSCFEYFLSSFKQINL